jgi:hypothetical protein
MTQISQIPAWKITADAALVLGDADRFGALPIEQPELDPGFFLSLSVCAVVCALPLL